MNKCFYLVVLWCGLLTSCAKSPTEEWRKAYAEIDNSSPDAWEVCLDGRKVDTVKPYAILRFEITPKSHTYTIRKGAEEVDKIEAKGEAGRVTVVNPKGASSYARLSAAYSQVSVGSGGTDAQELGSPRTVNSDFGLLASLPQSITVEQWKIMGLPMKADAAVTRDKLLKNVVGEIPAAKAVEMVTNCHRAFAQQHLVAAFEVLAKAPKSDEIKAALIACVDETDRALIAGKAYLALAAYEEQIPEEKLVAWFSTPPDARPNTHYENDYVFTEANATAGTERVKAGARIASRQNDGALLRARFGSLPEKQKTLIFEGLTTNLPDKRTISPSLLGFLVVEGLKSFADTQRLSHSIEAEDFSVDSEFVSRMDEFVAGQKEANTARFWRSVWWRKLAMCSQKNAEVPASARLVELVNISFEAGSSQFPDAIRDEALKGLLARQAWEQLVAMAAEAKTRPMVVAALFDKVVRNKEKPSSGMLKVVEYGLEDESPDVRGFAFSTLCAFGPDHLKAVETLRKVVATEKDASRRGAMRNELSALFMDKLADADESALLSCATAAISSALLARAFDKLLHCPNRAANMGRLAKAFTEVKEPEGRQLFITALKPFSGFTEDPAFAAAYNSVMRAAAIDSDQGVRRTAMNTLLETFNPLKDADAVMEAIKAETDDSLRAELLVAYDTGLLRRLKALRNFSGQGAGELNEQAARRLVDIACAAKDEKRVAEALEAACPAPTDMAAKLEKLYVRMTTEEARYWIVRSANSSDHFLGILTRALADQALRIRQTAFGTLLPMCRDAKLKPKILPLLKSAAGKEADPAEKQRMGTLLKPYEK